MVNLLLEYNRVRRAAVILNVYLEIFSFKWKGRKLMNTDSWFDFWDKSDPYLKFFKVRNDNTLIEVART